MQKLSKANNQKEIKAKIKALYFNILIFDLHLFMIFVFAIFIIHCCQIINK